MNIDTKEQRAKAFDHLFDAVVVTNMEGRITDWNKGSEELYGYTKEEALGHFVSILHVPEDSAKMTKEVLTAVEKDGKWSGEVRMLHKDGHIGWVESICVPFHNKNGEMEGALGINRDITLRKTEAEKVQHRANFDYLTNVPNRYLLLDRLTHLIAQCERNHRTFAVFFVDVDRLKMINDTRGHAAGDKVLIEVSNIIKQKTRHSDTVARFGGDEFVLILEDIESKRDALQMMQALFDDLNTECVIGGEALNITSSVGFALYPDDGSTVEMLLANADKAMYTAKVKNRR